MGEVTKAFDDQNIAAQLEQYFRQSDAQRNSLLENVFERYELLQQSYEERCNDYEQLHQRYEEKCNDHKNEVQSRRLWQNKFETALREQQNIPQGIASNPFVLALIDGDGAIFQDALLKAGPNGAADAAHNLLTEIKQYVQTNVRGADTWSVMVQIYTNLEGLGRKLAAIGTISNPAEIHAFCRAFSLNQPLFNIIDVGSGKERADHKLKEFFRLFFSNVQCKHIIFGGTHDAGYLPILDPYKRDGTALRRITLLESWNIQPCFKELGFPIIRFDSVFRTTNLPEKPMGISASPVQRMPTPFLSRQASSGSPLATPPSVTPPPPSTDTKTSSTWATVGKNGTTEKKINIASAKFVPRKIIILNAMDQRLDAPLAKPDKAAIDRVNDRTQTNKCCNEYHLIGRCNSQYCPYDHGERLSPQEQLALRHKTRQRSCMQGNSCRSFDCFWGHQCQHSQSVYGCMYGDDCHFARMHGKDLRPAMKTFEDGSVEIVH